VERDRAQLQLIAMMQWIPLLRQQAIPIVYGLVPAFKVFDEYPIWSGENPEMQT